MDQTNEEEIDKEAEGERLDFTKPSFSFKPKDIHSWRQQGPYLVCQSCDLEHGAWIGMDQLLVGMDQENQPILKAR